MIWHNFDIEKFIKLFLPIAMRKLGTIAWIKALLSPLDWLKSDILYRMQHDCRVMYMEKVLNEKLPTGSMDYDPNDHEATKVIYIGEGDIPERVWLNTSVNPDKIWLGTQYLNTSGFYDENYSDFIVHAPIGMQSIEARMRRLIDYYKLAGKAYKIEYFL